MISRVLLVAVLVAPLPAHAQAVSANAKRAAPLGVVGDGTTDDAAHLAKAAESISTSGIGAGALMLDSVPGYALTSGVTMPNGQQWQGGAATKGLRCMGPGPCLTTIGSNSGVFNLPLTFVGGDPARSVGVQMGAGEQGGSPVLRDLSISGFGIGVDVRSNVTGKLDNVTVNDSRTAGIRFNNVTNPDAGDWTFSGTTVSQPNGQGDLVLYQSGGGLKVTGFKGLGGAVGWHLSLPDGTKTQDLQFTTNSIENSTIACMKFERAAGDTKGVFGNITIVGNEFAGCPYGAWFAGPGISGAVVEGNAFSMTSGAPIRLDPGANNIVVGRNSTDAKVMVQDNRTGFLDEYGFVDRADTVAIASSSASNWATAYTLTLPPYRGASIHVVLEGIVQNHGSFTYDSQFLLTSDASGPLHLTPVTATTSWGPAPSVRIDTSTANIARIQYRLASGSAPMTGTATIVPLGKTISVSR